MTARDFQTSHRPETGPSGVFFMGGDVPPPPPGLTGAPPLAPPASAAPGPLTRRVFHIFNTTTHGSRLAPVFDAPTSAARVVTTDSTPTTTRGHE